MGGKFSSLLISNVRELSEAGQKWKMGTFSTWVGSPCPRIISKDEIIRNPPKPL
jgi:hypothetical protein